MFDAQYSVQKSAQIVLCFERVSVCSKGTHHRDNDHDYFSAVHTSIMTSKNLDYAAICVQSFCTSFAAHPKARNFRLAVGSSALVSAQKKPRNCTDSRTFLMRIP